MPNEPIRIKFTCKKCGLINEEFEVRQRRDQEPLDYWVDRIVGKALHGWHDLKSPGCNWKHIDIEFPSYVDTPPGQVGEVRKRNDT